MQIVDKLESGFFYHIYNRGNNRENIFIEDKNYPYFLSLFNKHTTKVADLYCYCLLKNHFHFLIKIKENSPDENTKLHQPFSNFFNAYSKSINKAYDHTGSLFEKRFERKRVKDNRHLMQLMVYIHLNPVKHRFTDNFQSYPYSSYNSIISDSINPVIANEIFNWFDDKENFEYCHNEKFLQYKNLMKEVDEMD